MTSRSLSYSWLPITIRWTALGMVLWPLAAIVVATLMFGMNAVVIDGESMHPALRKGDVVLTSPDSTDLVPGQVVTFDTENGRTTHRLVANTESGWVTAGDANQDVDSDAVARDDIEGVGVFVLPYVGWPRTQSPMLAVATAIGLFAVLAAPLRTVRVRVVGVALAALFIIGATSVPMSRASFQAVTTNALSTLSTDELPAPTDLVATSGCGSTPSRPYVDLSWQFASIGNSRAIVIERAVLATGPFTAFATLTPLATSHRDLTVASLTRYWYRVAATSGTWVSSPGSADTIAPACV